MTCECQFTHRIEIEWEMFCACWKWNKFNFPCKCLEVLSTALLHFQLEWESHHLPATQQERYLAAPPNDRTCQPANMEKWTRTFSLSCSFPGKFTSARQRVKHCFKSLMTWTKTHQMALEVEELCRCRVHWQPWNKWARRCRHCVFHCHFARSLSVAVNNNVRYEKFNCSCHWAYNCERLSEHLKLSR